jgi:hypothetical protein
VLVFRQDRKTPVAKPGNWFKRVHSSSPYGADRPSDP